MSTDTVVCPHCDAKLKAKSADAGKRIRCPKCKSSFALPMREDKRSLPARKVTDSTVRKPVDDETEQLANDPQPRRKRATRGQDDEDEEGSHSNPALLWGLIGGGAGIVVLAAVVIGIVLVVNNNNKGSSSSQQVINSSESSTQSNSQSSSGGSSGPSSAFSSKGSQVATWELPGDAPEWKADETLLPELGDIVHCRKFSVKPPKNSLFSDQKNSKNEDDDGIWAWYLRGATGFQPEIYVSVKPQYFAKQKSRDPGELLKDMLIFDHPTWQSGVEHGKCNGIAWHRLKFNGTQQSGTQKTQGFVYVAKAGSQLIECRALTAQSDQEPFLKALEAMVLAITFDG